MSWIDSKLSLIVAMLAYQVLLTEELARHGVEMVFIKAPHSGTPEDQLLIQFQGMIAE
jgi:site-specific DNA recombinase